MTDGARIKLLEKLYDIYLKDLISQPFCAVVKLWGMGNIKTKNKVIKSIYIDSQIIPGDYSRNHLCGKLFLAINDFLFNTTADWFFRLCDDTFINLNSFDLFFTELNRNSNPLTDKLVQGNCIHKDSRKLSYPQGGSGFIFSRFSAFELFNYFDIFTQKCNKLKSDDSSIGRWLSVRNYSFTNVTNRFFVGHQFYGFKKLLDIGTNYSKIKNCPDNFITSEQACRPFMTNLRNIVFWHDRVHFMEFLPFARKFIYDLPKDLYYYQIGVKPTVCRSSKKKLDRYIM